MHVAVHHYVCVKTSKLYYKYCDKQSRHTYRVSCMLFNELYCFAKNYDKHIKQACGCTW